MSKILIVYGTSYGHTGGVAQRLSLELARAGCDVAVEHGDQLPKDLHLEEFDGVIIGASVLFGKHQRYIREFVQRNVAMLNRIPSAFVSVSGAAIAAGNGDAAEAHGYITTFLGHTGWKPRMQLSLAGALAYRKYGFITRLVMKSISARTGRPTDTSRDYEFTEWGAVDRFAREFAHLVREQAPAFAGAAPN